MKSLKKTTGNFDDFTETIFIQKYELEVDGKMAG